MPAGKARGQPRRWRKCRRCGERFLGRPNTRYCTRRCRKRAENEPPPEHKGTPDPNRTVNNLKPSAEVRDWLQAVGNTALQELERRLSDPNWLKKMSTTELSRVASDALRLGIGSPDKTNKDDENRISVAVVGPAPPTSAEPKDDR